MCGINVVGGGGGAGDNSILPSWLPQIDPMICFPDEEHFLRKLANSTWWSHVAVGKDLL